jgi:homoprotocatechuate degradation regulator HpaR
MTDQSAAPPRGKLRPFSKSLPMALLRAREAVMRHFRPALRHFGITEQQWRVLRALQDTELEITALAEATHLLAPSLSRILQDLEQRGLVKRRTSPEDLRRSLVSVSPDGAELLVAVGGYSEAIYGQLAARLGAERLQTLLLLLKDLEGDLNEGPPISDQFDLPALPDRK